MQNYLKTAAPRIFGEKNVGENKGGGYDRWALLKGTTMTDEAAFIGAMLNLPEGFYEYAFLYGNCSSFSMMVLDAVFDDAVSDGNILLDIPNVEFDDLYNNDRFEITEDAIK